MKYKHEMPSFERRKYLKNIKIKHTLIWTIRIAILVLFIFAWELLANINVIDSFLFSSPSRVIKTIINLQAQNQLTKHIFTTLWETLIGFAIATIIGTLIALILWLFENARLVLEPYLVVLNALPKIALGPIIIIAFGAGQKSIIFMTVFKVLANADNVYVGKTVEKEEKETVTK